VLTGTRLLTLTGAGGSGKTRLALEVARRELSERGIPGAWIDLAPITDPSLFSDAILSALGVRDESDAPAYQRVAIHLGESPFLLVLDNAEHVLDECAAFVHALLRESDVVRVIVTSRAALGVAGETAWLVPPLSVTSEHGEPEAVQLFVQRGQAANSSFAITPANRGAIHQICTRLDGLPLALELAAARLRVLTPGQVASRLDDRFRLLTSGNRAALPRQQTLRATIDWSYGLLNERERNLLARLSVFRGSFTLEAAEAVGSDESLPVDDLLDVMSSLVEQSMVDVVETKGEARYRLLETIREYGAERLNEAGKTERFMRAHAAFYGRFIREVEPLLRTARRPEAMARILPELENLRAAMSCSRVCDVQIHLRIVGMLHWFWFSSGQWPEAQQWLSGALSLPEARNPTIDRAHLLFSAGAIAALQARCDEAIRLLEEAESIAEREDAPELLANIRNYLAMSLNQLGDSRAIEVLMSVRPWMVRENNLNTLRLNYLLHGQALVQLGDLAGAVAVTEDAVRVARVFGLPRELGINLQQLATIVARTGDWTRTRSLLVEALAALREDPMPLFTARALELMGSSAAAAGAATDAGVMHGAAAAVRDTINAPMWNVDRKLHEQWIERARAVLGEAGWQKAFERGRSLPASEIYDQAIAIASRLGSAPTDVRTEDTQEFQVVLPPSVEGGPPLRVQALGTLRLLVHGVEKELTAAKARELLVFLLSHPAGLSREQIGVALWPDASSTQLRNNFHVAMHHLRRALEHPEWVRFEQGRYAIDVPGGVGFDAREFEEAAAKALRDVRRGSASIADLQGARARYGGEFMAGETAADWSYETRERLAKLHADITERLGTALLDADRASDAVEVLESLVNADGMNEGASRTLMQARAAAGDRSGAVQEFRRLEGVLRREGFSPPSRETQELYRRLQN
jgi:predicted ATPase/DNA-binding SARP family transcriptional activator